MLAKVSERCCCSGPRGRPGLVAVQAEAGRPGPTPQNPDGSLVDRRARPRQALQRNAPTEPRSTDRPLVTGRSGCEGRAGREGGHPTSLSGVPRGFWVRAVWAGPGRGGSQPQSIDVPALPVDGTFVTVVSFMAAVPFALGRHSVRPDSGGAFIGALTAPTVYERTGQGIGRQDGRRTRRKEANFPARIVTRCDRVTTGSIRSRARAFCGRWRARGVGMAVWVVAGTGPTGPSPAPRRAGTAPARPPLPG